MVQVVSKLSGLLVLTMLLFATALSGTGAAVPVDGTGNDPITVRQGGECYRPTPLGNGSEAVGSFYDYRVSTNYSSTGTIRFQEHQVSNLFVYNGSDGYSLVFLHDAYEDGAPYGSTVTFEITGLPAAGSWPVEDDDYPDQDDNFTHDGSRSEIDWMWAPERTDGAAFRGLATEPNASITVDPRFNERADEWGDWTWSGNRNNVVTEWRLLGENATEVTTLDMNRNVTVSVGPCDRTAPTASLLADETNATVGASITFDAGNSTDNEGIVTYRWDYDGDGTVDDRTDTATTTHAYANASEYNATVTVVDEAGNADSATATVGVTTAANTEAPSATLDTPSQAASGAGITLDASNSTDDEGIARYRWDYDADGTVDRRTTAATVTTSYDRLGEYNVTVTVVDGANNTDSATATITVTEPADTEAPSALLDAPNQTVVGTTVTLDASNATDDEGIVQYRWDYDGDGAVDNTTSAATTTIGFENASEYTPSVTVVDGAGNEDSANASLAVQPADTEPPTATLDVPSEVTVGETFTAEANNVTDANSIVKRRWYYDGTEGRNGPTRISFAERGDHTVSLELRDAVGNNRTITRTVSATADGSDRQQPADGGSNDRSGSPGGSTGPSNPGGQDATPPAAPSPPPADTAPGDESEPTDEPDTATPSLSVSSIRADNRTVAPGEPVTVTVVVTNAGDATGSYTATLTTAGSTRTDSMSVNDTVTVPAGENRSLALSTAFDRPGEYDLQAGNSTLGVVVNETTELSPPDQPDRSPSETPDGTPGETPPPPTETPPPPTETPVLTPGPTPPEPQAGNSTPTPGETSTDTTTGGPTEPLPDTPTSQTPGTDGPGFGFFSAIVSIILAALVRSRRR